MNTSVELKVDTQLTELRQTVRDILAENVDLRQKLIDMKEHIEWLESQLEAAR